MKKKRISPQPTKMIESLPNRRASRSIGCREKVISEATGRTPNTAMKVKTSLGALRRAQETRCARSLTRQCHSRNPQSNGTPHLLLSLILAYSLGFHALL